MEINISLIHFLIANCINLAGVLYMGQLVLNRGRHPTTSTVINLLKIGMTGLLSHTVLNSPCIDKDNTAELYMPHLWCEPNSVNLTSFSWYGGGVWAAAPQYKCSLFSCCIPTGEIFFRTIRSHLSANQTIINGKRVQYAGTTWRH